MDTIFIRTHLGYLLTDEFLLHTMKKYHYPEGDLDILRRTAERMQICLRGQECMELLPDTENHTVEAAFTLGKNLDELQASYGQQGRVAEQMAVEHLAAELLNAAYKQAASIVLARFGRAVHRIHFYGSEEAYPLEAMQETVDRLEGSHIRLTPRNDLIPTKSVICRLELADPADEEEHQCSGLHLCEECPMGRSGRCVFRCH